MAIKGLPIINYYDQQRFKQFSPMDVANWYIVDAPSGKKKKALYPAMGRAHVSVNGVNELIFDAQPRKIFKSIDYMYVVVSSTIYQVNHNFVATPISDASFTQIAGSLNFAYLPIPTVSGVHQKVFVMICDGTNIFVIDESNAVTPFQKVTDPNAPGGTNAGGSPLYVVAFGNRFAVSNANSTQFNLSQINLGGGSYNPSTCFTVPDFGPIVFAQESGIIRQMATLQNQLYIFTDFTTGIWSNIPTTLTSASTSTQFPWRKNTSFEFDYGIADPDSIDVDFGMMAWLGQNRNGLVTFMMSNGQSPTPISSQAVNVLIQNISNSNRANALLEMDTQGFLYQYEDTIFYRVSIGAYVDYGVLDRDELAVCLEYNFSTETWHRNIELNGERNRIEQHEFFNNKHLVTLLGDSAMYQMAGDIYFNEITNPDPNITNPQSPYYFLAYPMRYENVTPILSEDDYSEFITDYIEIDFVYGDNTYIQWNNGFQNTVFIIGELPDPSGNPVYMVAEDGFTYIIEDGTGTQTLDDETYTDLFNPHIELYISDNGGISFYSADILEFSQLGIYQWRMRWYQGGPSRNRVYKLVCVSAAPIVVLGGVQNVRRASGGGN